MLGQTRDDAAGEAFDKTAKLLGLALSGGPAAGASSPTHGTAGAYRFPRPMLDRRRTRVQLLGTEDRRAAGGARRRDADRSARADVARAVQEAIVDDAHRQGTAGARIHRAQVLVVSGGVGANRALRERLEPARPARRRPRVLSAHRILHRQCRDDRRGRPARLKAGEHDALAIEARAQWPLESLPPLSPRRARLTQTHEYARDGRPDIPARPHRRMHHRLHRLGAPRQADRGARPGAARRLPPRRAQRRRGAIRSITSKVAKRVLAFVEASQFQLVETLAQRLALRRCSRSSASTGCASPSTSPARSVTRATSASPIERSRAELDARPELGRCPRSTSPPAATSRPSASRLRGRRARSGFPGRALLALVPQPRRRASRARLHQSGRRVSTERLVREVHCAPARRSRATAAAATADAVAAAALDLDLLLYGDLVCEEPELRLPRPDLLKRAYMLGPLAELAPQMLHPTTASPSASSGQRFDKSTAPARADILVTPRAVVLPADAATAVDGQDLARDIRRVGGEEQAGAGHVLRASRRA